MNVIAQIRVMVILGVGVLATPAFGQFTLSGMTLWQTTDANGTWVAAPLTNLYWNTLGNDAVGGDGDTVANIYLFTGGIRSTASPINSGDLNSSLNPNLSLSLGQNVIYFASHSTASGSGAFGINLFFNGDLVDNRISAQVPNNGTSSFSAISAATNTYGETSNYGASIAGSGSLSYSAGGYLIELSNFYVLAPDSSLNLVGYFNSTPAAGVADTNGSITLTVTAIPEPSTCAALAGLGVLGFAAYRKRNR